MGIVCCAVAEIPRKEKKSSKASVSVWNLLYANGWFMQICRMNRLLGIILLFKHVQLLSKI